MKRVRGVAMACGTAAFVLLGSGGPLRAQTGRVAVEEENFRDEPQGTVLARLLEGTELSLGESRGRWREATLEAWIWGRSVREQSAELDLIVNAEGENLRATPNGRRIGRAEGGMRLERLETRGDWIRARRTGWIWQPSLEAGDDGTDGDPPSPPAPPTTIEPTREFGVAGEAVVVLDNPAGDTLARLREGATVEVMAREGEWTRVRVEGWTFSGALAGADTAAGGVLREIGRDTLQGQPERYRGRLIEWDLQFIALQEAERFRTDFLEGEPFILARGPGDDPGFVYVAVPAEQLASVQSLSPLQRIRVLARVRTARSSLTDAPVLELLEIIGR